MVTEDCTELMEKIITKTEEDTAECIDEGDQSNERETDDLRSYSRLQW